MAWSYEDIGIGAAPAMSNLMGGSAYQGGALRYQRIEPQFQGDAPHFFLQQAPGPLQVDQMQLAKRASAREDEKFDLFKNLYGNLLRQGTGGGNSNMLLNLSRNPFSVPAPNYVPTSPVWTQQQIDAQSNLQRANLQQQAATQNRQFSNQLGVRGFSPLSPLADFMANNNAMKANASAASNETQLNFGAAQANSDARLKAAQINAGMWGDWVKGLVEGQKTYSANLLSQQDMNLRQQEVRNQLILGLMGGLR